jgi:hypothetical protein
MPRQHTNLALCGIELHHVGPVLIENPVRRDDAQKEIALICHIFLLFQFRICPIPYLPF